jgi:hypothetical protein
MFISLPLCSFDHAFLQVPQAAQRLSAVWKSMSSEERREWEEKAEKDRERYKIENAVYLGPRTMPNAGQRLRKDKTAPKRPMSAFLDYSKHFRTQVIEGNLNVKDNKDISKILGKIWREASEEEKRPFIEKELKLRAEYKEEIKAWRKERDGHLLNERRQRETMVQEAIESGTTDKLVEAAELSRRNAETTSHAITNDLHQPIPNAYPNYYDSAIHYWAGRGDYSAAQGHSYTNVYQSSSDGSHPGYNIHNYSPHDYHGMDYHGHHSSADWLPYQAREYAVSHADTALGAGPTFPPQTHINHMPSVPSSHPPYYQAPPLNFHSPVGDRGGCKC